MGSTELMGASVNNSPYENAYVSVFGRVNYNYKSKYYAQANFRYDGSGRFKKGNRWGFFPSVSAGWVLTQEKFMEGARNVLSFLKLRASYGQLGNDRIGNYPYQSTLSSNDPVGFRRLLKSGTGPARVLGLSDGSRRHHLGDHRNL